MQPQPFRQRARVYTEIDDLYDTAVSEPEPEQALGIQLALILKLGRALDMPQDPVPAMTRAEASDRITELSAIYEQRRWAPRGR